jgi:hypothetical protein
MTVAVDPWLTTPHDTQPLLGSIQARLSLVTRAYFDQGNFEDTQMLALVRRPLSLSLVLVPPQFLINSRARSTTNLTLHLAGR